MKKLKKIYIEITNACNLSCAFCPKTKRPVQFMSRELFEDILCRIKGNSEYLYFHVMGEPLLHPEIMDFLGLCDKNGYKVNITTNGTLIETAGEAILSCPALRQVNFSLHSFEANENQNSLDSYLDKIFGFIKRAQEKGGPLISLRLWNISENGKNRENKFILNKLEREFGLEFSLEDKLASCDGIEIAEKVYLNQAEVFDWPDIELEDISCRGFCHGLRDQAAILVDGTVVPCCLDREGVINLGNIKENKLEDIITGERALNLYNGFSCREVVEPLCRKCGYRARFL